MSLTLAEQYLAGATVREVAKANGISPTVTHKRLVAAGVSMRPVGRRGKSTGFRREVVSALEHSTWRATADHYGVSLNAISQWRRELSE